MSPAPQPPASQLPETDVADGQPAPFQRPISPSRLRAGGQPIAIFERADADERARICAALDLLTLQRLELSGTLTPSAEARDSWRFEGELRADYTQHCVATLEPIVSSLATPVRRLWLPAAACAEAIDAVIVLASIPDDDDAEDPEPIESGVDLGTVAVEALSLLIDPYPRAADAPPMAIIAAPPGVEPLTDAALKPFATLAQRLAEAAPGGGDDAARSEEALTRTDGDAPDDESA